MVAQLYVTPTSCGVASYIAAKKAGILNSKVIANLADTRNKKVLTGDKKGSDFKAINPKGNVPTLVLNDNTVLNENAAVLLWIADQNPDSALAPPWGTSARYLLQSKLSYISSEVLALVGHLFRQPSDEAKKDIIARFRTNLEYMSKYELPDGKKYLVGDQFTVADSYLYIVLSWLGYFGINLDEYPVLKTYYENIRSLDFVKEAHAELGKMAVDCK